MHIDSCGRKHFLKVGHGLAQLFYLGGGMGGFPVVPIRLENFAQRRQLTNGIGAAHI